MIIFYVHIFDDNVLCIYIMKFFICPYNNLLYVHVLYDKLHIYIYFMIIFLSTRIPYLGILTNTNT